MRPGEPDLTYSVGVAGVKVRRLALAYRRVVEFAGALAETHPPGLVYVEQASGKRRSPELVYMVGVIQAALVEALGDVRIEVVPPSSWKAAAGIGGQADKAKIMAWARERGFEGLNQDEADALGIGVAAARRLWPPQASLAA